jgi:rhodanese-related sulfurtransferase
MPSPLADMRGAGKEHTVLDVREARELDICGLEGALHIRWRRFRLAPTTFRRMNCWWSFAIMALAVR